MSATLPPLPLARIDSENVFSQGQTFGGTYNSVLNGCVEFIRDTVTTPMAGIRFIDKDDPARDGSGNPHWAGWMMDWAGLGGYHAYYDNVLDEDIIKIGFRAPQLGRFAFGADPINPQVQMQVHDLDAGIQWSLSTWSWNNGIKVNSRARFADCLLLQRDETALGRFIAFSQGNTSHDTRVGMEPGTYDLVFCNPNGAGPSTPENPGPVRFRIKGDGQISSPTIDELKARIAALEKVVLQKQQPQEPQ